MRRSGPMALVFVLAALALAPLASASTWTVTALQDDHVQGPLFGVACPASSLCVAAEATA